MSDTTNTHIPTIVFVEDNDGDAVLLEEALRESDLAVQLLVIPDGAKALHYFKVKASARDLPPPHCILLDHHLPLVMGSELLRFIRSSEAFAETPVYLFIDEIEGKDLLEAQLISKKSLLTKPNSWDGFLQLAHLVMRSATGDTDTA